MPDQEADYNATLECLRTTLDSLDTNDPLRSAAEAVMNNIVDLKKQHDKKKQWGIKNVLTLDLTEGLREINAALNDRLNPTVLEKLLQYEKKIPHSNLKRNLKIFIVLVSVVILVKIAVMFPVIAFFVFLAVHSLLTMAGTTMAISAIPGISGFTPAMSLGAVGTNVAIGVAQPYIVHKAMSIQSELNLIYSNWRYDIVVRKLEATIANNPLKDERLVTAAKEALNTIQLMKNTDASPADVYKLIETLWMVNMDLKHPPYWQKAADWPGFVYEKHLKGPLSSAYAVFIWPWKQDCALAALVAVGVAAHFLPGGAALGGASIKTLCTHCMQTTVPLSGLGMAPDMGVGGFAEAVGISRVTEHITHAAGWVKKKLGLRTEPSKPVKLSDTLADFRKKVAVAQLRNNMQSTPSDNANDDLTKIRQKFKTTKDNLDGKAYPRPPIKPRS